MVAFGSHTIIPGSRIGLFLGRRHRSWPAGNRFFALLLAIFVLPPVRFEMLQMADGMQLALFVAIAALVSLLGGVHRRQVDHLRQQDRRKDELLAILAHELLTPLAVATNALHLLRFADPDGAARKVRGILERQVAQMTRLIDDLL